MHAEIRLIEVNKSSQISQKIAFKIQKTQLLSGI